MLNTKHTPGPWKLLTEGDEDTCIVRTVVIEGKQRNLSEVALITTGSMSDEVEEANAKLIAAAPATLNVLIDAYLHLQGLSRVYVHHAIETDYLRASIRNQISEATGISCQEVQGYIEHRSVQIAIEKSKQDSKPKTQALPD